MATIAHDFFSPADRHTLSTDPYPGKELLWYRVTKVAGENPDTITYFCEHRKENRPAVLKEYFPARLARRRADGMVVLCHDSSITDFNRGLEIFIGDAENLDRLNHPNIAKVLDVFETNGTGYMARGYEQGRTLEEMVASRVTFGESELREILRCILGGLLEIHKVKLACRDLGAANIVVRPDGSAVLLVRVAVIGSSAHRPLWMPVSSLAGKVNRIDPSADIRAVGAILSRAVSGLVGAAGEGRIKDADRGLVGISIPALKAGRERYSQQFLQVIDNLLQPDPAGRAEDTEKWYRELALGNVKSGKIQKAAKTSSFEQQAVRRSHGQVSLKKLLRRAVPLSTRQGGLFAAASAYLARMKLREPLLHSYVFPVTAVLIAFSVALIASIDRYRVDTENRRMDSTSLPAHDALMHWGIKIPIFFGLPPESNTEDIVLQRMSMGQPPHHSDVLSHPLQALSILGQNLVFNRTKHNGNLQYLADRGRVDPLPRHAAREHTNRATRRDLIERLQRPERLDIAVRAKRTASRNSSKSLVTFAPQTRHAEHSPLKPPKRGDGAERRHQSVEGEPVTLFIERRDSRLDKIEQTERVIRPETVDRGRAERPEPIEKPTERTERPEVARLDRPERSERIERAVRLERVERLIRPERLERVERLVRPERLERVERLIRPERLERIERLVRPERLERLERLVRPERFERPERRS